MKRRPSRVLILDTILVAVWFGGCVGAGIWEHLS